MKNTRTTALLSLRRVAVLCLCLAMTLSSTFAAAKEKWDQGSPQGRPQDGNVVLPATWLKSGNNVYVLNGNVGIGTSNPQVKLEVSGDVKFSNILNCEKIITDTTGKLACGVDAVGAGGGVSESYVTNEINKLQNTYVKIGNFNTTINQINSSVSTLTTTVNNLSLSGDNLGNHTASNALNMSSQKINNLATPTSNQDAANKKYVDDTVAPVNTRVTNLTNTVNTTNSNVSALTTTVNNLSLSGDNMGNHIADKNITLGSHWISSNGTNTGIQIDSNGWVSIGVDTADTALDVNGNVSAKEYCDDGGKNCRKVKDISEDINSLTTTVNNLDLGGDNMGNHTATENIKLAGKWLTNNTEGDGNGIFINTNGNVGIGTKDANRLLKVEKSYVGDTRIGVLNENTGGVSRVVAETETNARGIAMSTFGSSFNIADTYKGNSMLAAFGTNNKLYLGAGNQAKISIAPNGQVGIGTLTPQGDLRLDVAGKLGADYYCDGAGNNCLSITGLATDSEVNTKIANAKNDITNDITSKMTTNTLAIAQHINLTNDAINARIDAISNQVALLAGDMCAYFDQTVSTSIALNGGGWLQETRSFPCDKVSDSTCSVSGYTFSPPFNEVTTANKAIKGYRVNGDTISVPKERTYIDVPDFASGGGFSIPAHTLYTCVNGTWKGQFIPTTNL